MTPLQQEPSAHAPCTNTMFGFSLMPAGLGDGDPVIQGVEPEVSHAAIERRTALNVRAMPTRPAWEG